jgi:hypothetical protein
MTRTTFAILILLYLTSAGASLLAVLFAVNALAEAALPVVDRILGWGGLSS